jgi:hypothetical protein
MRIRPFYKNTPFSNFHPSIFHLDGLQFLSGEQAFQYLKAATFKDDVTGQRILSTKTPHEAKQLGRKVINFNATLWDELSYPCMKKVLHAKFSQNMLLKAYLLDSIGTHLVEGSVSDLKWGVGISENDPKILNRFMWKGQNLLGKALMEIRDELK